MHQLTHIAEALIFRIPERTDLCPHIVNDRPADGNVLFGKFSALFDQTCLGNADLHRIPRAPAKVLKDLGIASVRARLSAAAENGKSDLGTARHQGKRIVAAGIAEGRGCTVLQLVVPGKQNSGQPFLAAAQITLVIRGNDGQKDGVGTVGLLDDQTLCAFGDLGQITAELRTGPVIGIHVNGGIAAQVFKIARQTQRDRTVGMQRFGTAVMNIDGNDGNIAVLCLCGLQIFLRYRTRGGGQKRTNMQHKILLCFFLYCITRRVTCQAKKQPQAVLFSVKIE